MPKKNDNTNDPHPLTDNEDQTNFPGYPIYPASEDIYQQATEAVNVDPENITATKTPNPPESHDLNPGGLDIPGEELDDAQEAIGNEDEENNFYSLGGDSHNDLEEDQGDEQ